MPVTNIVVSRYKKDVGFVYNIKGDVNILIYDKETPENPYNVPENKGNEASVYLKYIIDHYDDLPEYTFFMHDDEYAWHHSGSIIDKYYDAINSNKKYNNINDKSINCIGWVLNEAGGIYQENFLKWYYEYIHNYIPFDKLDHSQQYRSAAQFLVHRDLIRGLPKIFYENLYNWIMTTEIPSWLCGRFFEWTWHIFWDVYPTL